MPTPYAIDTIDHAVLRVRDLERAVAVRRQLHRRPSP